MESVKQFFNNDISITLLIVCLLIGSVLAYILKWHYIKFGKSINNRSKFSNLFIYLILTITLIIALIKTSLALSLGLVGALSIVRFRTPIKEPEELIYLFIAIAIGLGLGAEQIVPTVIASAIILIVTAAFQIFVANDNKNRLICSVSIDDTNDSDGDFKKVTDILKDEISDLNLVRSEISKNNFSAVYGLSINNENKLHQVASSLRKSYQDIRIVMIDQSEVPQI